MKIEKINELLAKCASLEEALEMAHSEALDVQKATGGENLDVMHISQSQEIVAMRIGYWQRQKEAEEEKAEAKKKKKAVDDAAAAPDPENKTTTE